MMVGGRKSTARPAIERRSFLWTGGKREAELLGEHQPSTSQLLSTRGAGPDTPTSRLSPSTSVELGSWFLAGIPKDIILRHPPPVVRLGRVLFKTGTSS